MQELKLPPTHEKAQAAYKTFGERVHWVDGNNMPGSFQMNTCWWYKSNREQTLAHPDSPVGKPHFHEHNCSTLLDVPDFENEFGVKVIVELFDSNEMMYTKLLGGASYDVLVPSDYMIEQLMQEAIITRTRNKASHI